MASVSKLSLTFAKENGDSMSINYSYADPNASASNIKTLMQSIVTNGDIFENPPVAIKSAKIVTTEETAIDLS
ncbi:MAG: DUF2922 domain-containing protein [Synergistaceae bacterium]|nr:DUF2922 domain-containing protein [Synergistaceae bacterium]